MRSRGSRSPCVRDGSPAISPTSAPRRRRRRFRPGSSCRARGPARVGSMLYSRLQAPPVLRSATRATMSSPVFSEPAGATPAMRQYLRRQAAVPRRHRVLPHGRLLRDVLRGRADRGARARADAHLAVEGRERRRASRCAACRFTPPTATSPGWSGRASASPSASRSRIRRRPRASSSARSCASSRRAR